MPIPPPPVRPASAATRLAVGLGYAINPLVLPAVLFALVAAARGAPGAEVAYVGAVTLGGFGVVPLAYVLHLLRRGRIASVEIVDRRARVAPLLVALAASGATCAVLAATVRTAAALLAALAAVHLVNTALLFLVTLRWKISLHAAALAGFAAVLAYLGAADPASGALRGVALGAAAAVPLLMWARVRAGVHTSAQVLGGALAGWTLPVAQLAAFEAVGWL